MEGAGSTRNQIILSATIVLLAVVVAWGLDAYGRRTRTYGADGPLGTPGASAVLIGTPMDAYRLWKERGYRGRVILYVGERWAKLDPNEYNIPPLYRPYPLPLYNLPREREREFLNDGNFLFMAALNGIARRVDAVLTPAGFAEIDIQARQARNATFDDGRTLLTHNGFPRVFSTAATVRSPGEPVLLYVGASYFRAGDAARLVQALNGIGLRADLVILCEEENDASLPSAARMELLRFAELAGLKRGAQP